MGFDKHFNEDHCYLDDPVDGVAMNVEVIEEEYQVADTNIIVEKPVIRYLDISGSSNSNMMSLQDTNKYPPKAVIYLPYNEYCTEHSGMYLHEDEKLVKPGDKFNSLHEFVQYLNENAKRWCFYYRCSDSHKPNTEYETYTYNCVYLRHKEKYQKKGMRKRTNNIKTDCPCKIKLRRLPNESELTVVHVCNHHDHELSLEAFYKLQHGRRLPHYVKEEIKDFIQLKVDAWKIKAYVEMETGFNMSRTFFYALEKNFKNKNVERPITQQRLTLLQQKIAAVDEAYGFDDCEQAQETQDVADDTEIPTRIKSRRSLKNALTPGRTPSTKRRSKTNHENYKRIKLEPSDNTSNETIQSVKDLQKSIKCEIQRNPWITDQTAEQPNCEETIQVQTVETLKDFFTQHDLENLNYTIEYFNADVSNSQEVVANELCEIINDGQVNEGEENEVTYETVVTDNIVETQNALHEFINNGQTEQEGIENQLDNQELVNDQSEILNDVNNTQDMVELENHVEYITEESADNGDVQYVGEIIDENCGQDASVQTANASASSTHSLLPVFDVYMKDGNVTGFVVNDNLISGLKDGVDKETQTSVDVIPSGTQDLEDDDFDGEIIHDTTNGNDIYTKHEYVHRYNLDKYMMQPHFPKYIEKLSKQTNVDVLHMFTNIYNEKAMFKITTMQKGKEGNTRIWYIKDHNRSKKHRNNEAHRKKMGQNLQSMFILKEKLRSMKRRNSDLMAKNKLLEEVALKLVDMT